ncbi:N-formylglutamate amidohydrolase [Ochrovirga pacifica]|uniref:N-formylglutamate amidohydrolase n=1 Tax=Ochrovirga pacifica TaxID=1042376 RepID=UPI0002558397|nr:N-formylglutamate amidohydrolase [Ochrovirga pacifica]
MKLILTCEHGGNRLPPEYQYLFQNHPQVLQTHKGFDLGSLDLFLHLSSLATFQKSNQISRLLVELNRSLHHPDLFSDYAKHLPVIEKKQILEQYYHIYRGKIKEQIHSNLDQNNVVLHLSVHTFTPILNGAVRQCDIGILYDPSRSIEKWYAKNLKQALLERKPALNVRYNYPYRGVSDGFTKTLRKDFIKNYIGIELEINQKYVSNNQLDSKLKKVIFKAIQESLQQKFFEPSSLF